MSTVRTFRKSPAEVLDYSLGWSLATGETISLSTWTIVKAEGGAIVAGDLTEDSSTNSDSATTIWLSGGIAATNYVVVNRITTSAGRTYERAAFRILCKAPQGD